MNDNGVRWCALFAIVVLTGVRLRLMLLVRVPSLWRSPPNYVVAYSALPRTLQLRWDLRRLVPGKPNYAFG